ncbi:MAG: hypothetical protein LIO79_05940 [Rikenellaceae bacterium]|nr:hypothetical protein [Rikenellaceae bacterium]
MEFSNFVYSGPYLFVLALFLILALVESEFKDNFKVQSWVKAGCMGLFLFFFGLRGYVG